MVPTAGSRCVWSPRSGPVLEHRECQPPSGSALFSRRGIKIRIDEIGPRQVGIGQRRGSELVRFCPLKSQPVRLLALDALQVLRSIASGGRAAPWVNPRNVVSATSPRHHRPRQIGIGQRRDQIRVREILPTEVPAGQVVGEQTDALQVLRLIASGGRELRLGEPRDVVPNRPPSPRPPSGWHWSASSQTDVRP